MPMTHMKMDQQEMNKTMAMGPEKRESYPYGLRVRLGDAEMKKLGMEEMPKVGDEIELDAKVKVVGTSANATEGGAKNRSVELQITHMELGGGEEEAGEGPDTKASTLYPNQGK
jgi:hypothetical protein